MLQFFYAAQSAVGYNVGKAAQGLANNSMTDAQRAELSSDDPEYHFRCVSHTARTIIAEVLMISMCAGWLDRKYRSLAGPFIPP